MRSDIYCQIIGDHANADWWITQDSDVPHQQFIHVFYEDWKFQDHELTLILNLN